MLNYTDNYWVIRIRDDKIVGYAPWDKINRRWTLFNLHGDYRGFIQAIIGQQFIKHERVDIWYQYYTQYLWYFKDNIYRGVMIASLGGRPKTEILPYGELGGSLDLYPFGNIPVKFQSLFVGIDPVQPPMGIDISIVNRLPTWKSKLTFSLFENTCRWNLKKASLKILWPYQSLALSIHLSL